MRLPSSERQREASEQQDVAGQSRDGRFRAGNVPLPGFPAGAGCTAPSIVPEVLLVPADGCSSQKLRIEMSMGGVGSALMKIPRLSAQAAQEIGMILKLAGEHVYHLPLALDLAGDAEEA